MRFNKIVDVTECDATLVQTNSERIANQMLQYDESDINMMLDNNDDYCDDDQVMDNLEHDLAIIHPESAELLDDWKCAEIKVDEIVSDPMENEERRFDLSPADSNTSMDSFFKPEADQNGNNTEKFLSDNVEVAMKRSNRDMLTLTQADD
jgi:hypothetical protein